MQEGDADVVSAKWNEQNSTNVSMNRDMVGSNHCKMLVPCVCAKYWGTSMTFCRMWSRWVNGDREQVKYYIITVVV